MEADMVLESRVLHLADIRKLTVTLREEKDLKAQPYSDTLPTEGVAKIKGVPSSLKVWIKGVCRPAFSTP